MKRLRLSRAAVALAAGLVLAVAAAPAAEYKPGMEWPEPKVIDPGPVGGPPSDAIVLFDGKDLSQWNGGEKWIIKDGYAIANGREHHHASSRSATASCTSNGPRPTKVEGDGQGRGNSGVYLMGRYEVQILDSYDNKTYFDGQAGVDLQAAPAAGQRLPQAGRVADLRHHLRPPPKFDGEGKLVEPAYVTVLHNGVLVQNHFELEGDTPFTRPPKYTAHPDKLPLRAAVPRQPGAVPQHLDPRDCGDRRQTRGGAQGGIGAGSSR